MALARPLAKRERDADEPEPRRVVRVGGGEGAPRGSYPGLRVRVRVDLARARGPIQGKGQS